MSSYRPIYLDDQTPLALSALPNAPIVEDPIQTPGVLARAVAAVLVRLAGVELVAAQRLDPRLRTA